MNILEIRNLVKHYGGEPANFLDIGGGASPERVAKAFNLVLSDQGVHAILVNIFAGINRCDWVAEGVIQAMRKLDVSNRTQAALVARSLGLDLRH